MLSKFAPATRTVLGQALHSRRASTAGAIPLIEFGRWMDGTPEGKQAVANELRDACENIGFFALTDHRVDPTVIDAAWTSTRDFFDLPAEYKDTFVPENEAEYPYGYTSFGAEILAAGKDLEDGVESVAQPDLKECFSMGPYNPASGMPPPRLPAKPAEFNDTWMAYYKAMEGLSAQLLSAMAVALELPETWFEDKIDRHRCAMRALNYPDLDTPPLPGQLRASAHTDYGTVTILRPDAAPGGLQVLQKNGEWGDVEYIPDAYVINIGDLMQRWTNDAWVSTMHRVVNPPIDAGQSCRRQSIAFFHNINADYVVDCIDTCHGPDRPKKYPKITAFDHLMEKHLASMGQSPDDDKN